MKIKSYWENQRKKSLFFFKEEDLFKSYWSKRYSDNLKYLKGRKRILDIGCGNAKYFLKLENKYEEFWGIELSPVHFKAAKKIFPKGNYISVDGLNLPFKNESFDAIISFGAFEHNENIITIFRECSRLLTENGKFLFSVPNYNSLYYPYSYFYHTINNHDIIAAIGYNYSKKFLEAELKKVGFENVIFVDSIYAAPFPVVGLIISIIKC